MKELIKLTFTFILIGIFLSVFFFFSIYPNAFSDELFRAYDPIISFIFVTIEWMIVLIFFILCYRKKLVYKTLCMLVLALVLFTQATQFMSLYNSQEYLTPLALAHSSLVGLLVTFRSVFLVNVIVIIPLSLLFLALRKLQLHKISTQQRVLVAVSILLLTASVTVLENNAYIFKNSKLNYKANEDSMLTEMIKLLRTYDQVQDIKEPQIKLTQEDIKIAQQHGIFINYKSEYPLVKNFFYQKVLNNNLEHPNMIVFFVESFNSRLLGAYSGKYPGISPNIDKFALKSTIIKNYYNHAFPTIVGLRGQLCSNYPRVQSSLWAKAKSIIKLNKLKCLPKILNEHTYDTTYFGYSHPKETFFKDQMMEFGFKEADFYTELLKKFTPNKKQLPARGHYGNSDQQMFEATSSFLKKRNNNKPFFLAVSTIETHPGMDPLNAKDIPFKNLTLRAINNFDTQFGKFWNHFKKSKYANNTIIVLTSDHAHVPNMDYISVAGKNYSRDNYFDPNTLIIYDPTRNLPKGIKTSGSSIDLAPTITQLLNIPNEPNHFLGLSLFTDRENYKSSLGLINQSRFLINRPTKNIFKMDLKNCQTSKSLECSLYRTLRFTQYIEFQNKTSPL